VFIETNYFLFPLSNQLPLSQIETVTTPPLVPPREILHQIIGITTPNKFRYAHGTESSLFPDFFYT
jgi:hypothetical protein